MALLPLNNITKMAFGFESLLLNWLDDLPNEPRYLPGHGSIELEVGFGVRRSKEDAIGVLGFANEQLKALLTNTLISKGKLLPQPTTRAMWPRRSVI